MYKKILIVLCIVIALFFIVPIVYVLWTREPNIEAFTVKGPFISIFLRNHTKQNSSLILLHDIPNSEFILDRSILSDWDLYGTVSDRSTNIPSSKPHWQRKSILFECNANVPVKWQYEGEGIIPAEIRHFNKREIKDFDNNSTYWFMTSMEFFSIDEQLTGKFVCRSIEMSEIKTMIFIYGKDGKTFVTNEQQEYEVEPGETMTVKCPISDPSRRILLRQLVYLNPLDARDSRGSDLFEDVDESIILSFDPKVGFTLLPDNWNSYTCVDTETGEESGFIKLYKPLKQVVSGDFLQTYLTNIPLQRNTSGLRLICEAMENVTLNFINFNLSRFKRKQVYYYNSSATFPFSSRIILRNEYFLNYSTVECVTTRDNRLLRVWKYLKKQWSDKTSFRFVNESKAYECCTVDEGNMEIPRLTQATCYTQAECEMKRSCVKLENKCTLQQILNHPIYGGSPGCALAKVEKNPSGILECSYGNLTKNYLYFFHPKTGFHNFTSSDFFRKKKVPVSTMIRIEQSGISKWNNVDMVTFDCYGPKFFFANGFQWEIKGQTGSRKIINKSLIDEESVAELHESIHLPLAEVKGKFVICHAPLLNARTEWVHAKSRLVN